MVGQVNIKEVIRNSVIEDVESVLPTDRGTLLEYSVVSNVSKCVYQGVLYTVDDSVVGGYGLLRCPDGTRYVWFVDDDVRVEDVY